MGAGMTPRAIGLAARLVRFWTRLYTIGLPARVRDARLSDIDCDLWECQHDPTRPARPFEILTRLLLGVPHDLMWRFEQPAAAGAHIVAPARHVVAASAFTCSFTLHLIALAGMLWWASWPADRTSPRVWTSRAGALEGPALLAGAPLTVSESEWPARLAPPEKDTAMKKAALRSIRSG